MNIDPAKTRVALLAGGNSDEREISLASGEGAGKALREAGFAVDQIDPAHPDDLKTLIDGAYDVAFLCLHGKLGEDGTVQGMLEVLGIPYTGPGVWSSATAMDKTRTKVVYRAQGINTPAGVTLYRDDAFDPVQLVAEFGLPLMVKPGTEGSALGVTIVQREEDLQPAVDQAFSLDTQVLVEACIEGTELTVAVLGNQEPYALPVIQIIPQNEFYDYESKYTPGGSQHICPAPLDAETTAAVQDMAIAAHKALDCRGMSRTDIFLDAHGMPWALETNTIPGMTSTSLLPDAARAAGISFPELCTRLIAYALEEAQPLPPAQQ